MDEMSLKYIILWFLPYWKKHKYRMFFIIFLGLLSSFIQALSPFYVKKILNGLEMFLSSEYIVKNSLLLLFLGFLYFLVNLFAQRNRAYMNYRIEYEVRDKVFKHLLGLDEFIFFRYSKGDIITRLIDDISEKIAWFSCSGVFRFLQAIFTLIAVISVMLHINAFLTLIALIPMPFMVIFVIKGGHILSKKYDELQKSISLVYDFIETSFSGIRIIKANIKEDFFSKKFEETTKEQMIKSIDSEKKQLFIRYIFFFTAVISSVLVYVVGGLYVIKGNLSVGDIVSFQLYTTMIIWPLNDVSQFFISATRAGASIKRLEEILVLKPRISFVSCGGRISDIEGIELKDIVFEIDGKRIIDRISLSISKGQKIAIVGKIGSSKSTLLKIISRILPFDNGVFLVNGIDINNIDLSSYYSLVSYVSQEPVIMSDTILNNITMYHNYSKEDIEKAISISQLEKDILSMSNGILTRVGNRGITLSGGQRQRISLARAIIRKPSLLIIDDATNQMDVSTEKKFWNDFFKHFNGTVIFVTHRTSTIEMADYILVLDDGKIIEKGTHQQLISRDTLYSKIYARYKLDENQEKKQNEI